MSDIPKRGVKKDIHPKITSGCWQLVGQGIVELTNSALFRYSVTTVTDWPPKEQMNESSHRSALSIIRKYCVVDAYGREYVHTERRE